MAKFQVLGDEEKLKGGPRTFNADKFKGGAYGVVGDHVGMSSKPVPLQQGNTGIRGGSHSIVGDSVTMSSAPHKGWNSYSTPVSDRASFQSFMPGVSGKGKKRK